MKFKLIGLSLSSLLLLSACGVSEEEKDLRLDPESATEELRDVDMSGSMDEAAELSEDTVEEMSDAEIEARLAEINEKIEPGERYPVTLDYATDGDTVQVTLEDGESVALRLLLIDTPETKHPDKGVEPFGPEASERMKEFLAAEGNLEIEYDWGSQIDKYDRHLVYLYANGISVQEVLLEEGLARVGYIYEQQRYLEKYEFREQQARDKGLGIWSIPGYVNTEGEGFTDAEK